jgi:hypothetical protein
MSAVGGLVKNLFIVVLKKNDEDDPEFPLRSHHVIFCIGIKVGNL